MAEPQSPQESDIYIKHLLEVSMRHERKHSSMLESFMQDRMNQFMQEEYIADTSIQLKQYLKDREEFLAKKSEKIKEVEEAINKTKTRNEEIDKAIKTLKQDTEKEKEALKKEKEALEKAL